MRNKLVILTKKLTGKKLKRPATTRSKVIMTSAVAAVVALGAFAGNTIYNSPPASAYHSSLCYDLWRHSGFNHLDNVRWVDCHNITTGSNGVKVGRVHVCRAGGWLHGITVWLPGGGEYYRYDHAHEYRGEGCRAQY